MARLATNATTVRREVWHAACAAAGAILIFLIRYLRIGDAPVRPAIESLCVFFIALCVISRSLGNAGTRSAPKGTVPIGTISVPMGTVPVWMLAVLCGAALMLYAPSLGIGLLSDDFDLTARGAAWDLTTMNAQAFRPLPLVVWGLLHTLGTGTRAIHAVNILFHGANAWLTARIARAYASSAMALCAGLVMLTCPLSVEAVTWSSGVFDVTALTCMLLAIIAGRRLEATGTWRDRLLMFGCFAAGVLCKESAAVAPLLVVADGYATGRISRRLLRDCAIAAVVMAAYGLTRLAVAEPSGDASKYRLQRFVFTSVGSFLFPWHQTVAHSHPSIVLVYSVLLATAALLFAGRELRDRRLLQCAMLAAWMLLATAPAFALLFVAQDLEGSRYLYAGSVAWAIVVLTLVESATSLADVRRGVVAWTLVVGLTACSVFGVWWHQQPWQHAARLRDEVLARAVGLRASAPQCSAVSLLDVPATVEGAFVLRNGVRRAAAGVGVVVRDDVPGCRFAWKNGAFVRED